MERLAIRPLTIAVVTPPEAAYERADDLRVHKEPELMGRRKNNKIEGLVSVFFWATEGIRQGYNCEPTRLSQTETLPPPLVTLYN